MSAAQAFHPPHEERGAAYRRSVAPIKSLASDPLVWLTSGWRTKAMQWLIDGQGQREVILRNAVGQFACCKKPGQLASVPDSYYGTGCSLFYRFSKTYIAIKPGVPA